VASCLHPTLISSWHAEANAPKTRSVEELLRAYAGKAGKATLPDLASAFHLGKYGRPLSSLVELGEPWPPRDTQATRAGGRPA
jgi:hypothetical protein